MSKSPKSTTTKTSVTTVTAPSPAKVATPTKVATPAASPKKRAAGAMTTDVKPKKAAPAYMIWLNTVGRKEIIATLPAEDKNKVAVVAKAAGEKWKTMSAADKKPWDEKAVKDKARFEAEMKNYVPSETSEPKKKKGKKGKKEKDPNKPKKALSAYFLWLNSVGRKEIVASLSAEDAKKVAIVGKAAGDKWKAMSATDKSKYERLAEQDKERFAKEMEEYKANNGGDDDDEEEEEEE